MTENQQRKRLEEATAALDTVQAEMYAILKSYGFRKHGRLFHRFVDGDISQVVEIQRGQAYREETHLFWINIGIRLPECVLKSFHPEVNAKKYYHEYQCNMRWTLGEQSKKKTGEYNLRKPLEPMVADIKAKLENVILHVFEVLNSRDSIMAKRHQYPQFSQFVSNHPMFDCAMICGCRGEIQRAIKLLLDYGCEIESDDFPQHYPSAEKDPQACLQALANRFNIEA